MTGNGIRMYDLAGNFCGECGRPKMNRLYDYGLTGCPECDEAITRHRCEHLPRLLQDGVLEPGSRYTCWDCRSVWVLVAETGPCPDCCDDCGHEVTARRWEITEDRRATGPRRDPRGYSPMRNLLPGPSLGATLEAEEYDRRQWIAEVAERLGLVLMTEKTGP